jgi:hypothetical protein
MREESAKKSKLSWSKSLVRKWFNIRTKAQDFHADSETTTQGRDGGGGAGGRASFSASSASTSSAKKSRTGTVKRSIWTTPLLPLSSHHTQTDAAFSSHHNTLFSLYLLG